MTYEETVQLANNGDVASMIDLGHYFSQHHDYVHAAAWYRKASACGNLFGTMRVVYCNVQIMNALMYRAEYQLRLDIQFETVGIEGSPFRILLANRDFLSEEYPVGLRTEPDNLETFGAEMAKAATDLGIIGIECNYLLANYQEVIDKTENSEEPQERIVRALAIIRIAPEESTELYYEAISKAFETLTPYIPAGYPLRIC